MAAQGQRAASNDAGLALVNAAWDRLPEAVRAGILAMIRAAADRSPEPPGTAIRLSRSISTADANLVCFLAGREPREARIDTIVTEFYRLKPVDKQRRRTARRRAERTRRALDGKGCPLRLTIVRSVVRLIDAGPVV
jgi:hypothetical protein